MEYKKRFNPDSLSNDVLLSELKKLADFLGRTPSQSDIKKYIYIENDLVVFKMLKKK